MTSIWNTALNILARREHSQHELRSKLMSRFPEQADEVEEVLLRLIDSGLQSDQRFCEMWFRYQVSKGRGPVRISMEAKQKGVGSDILQLIEASDIDWFEAALGQAKKKFPSGLTFEQRAKAYRFLSYRGYSSDSVQYAISEILLK
jgi:regulatory protein